MDFRLLGPLEVHDDSEPLGLGPPKQHRLSAEGEKSTLDEAVVEALAALD